MVDPAQVVDISSGYLMALLYLTVFLFPINCFVICGFTGLNVFETYVVTRIYMLVDSVPFKVECSVS